jgi:hypothetical protein
MSRAQQNSVVAQEGAAMASGQKVTVFLVTEHNPKSKEPLHADFANVQDAPEALAYFTERWGAPAVGPDGELDVERSLAFRDILRSAWHGNKNADGSPQMSELFAVMRVTPEQRIEAAPGVWQTAYLLFMRDRLLGKTHFCARPGCLNPYFVGRKTRRFCGDWKCTNYGAKQRRKKYNDAPGHARRKRVA